MTFGLISVLFGISLLISSKFLYGFNNNIEVVHMISETQQNTKLVVPILGSYI